MFIKLTKIIADLTEEAKDKLDSFDKDVISRISKPPTDEEGHDLEWYENMGMTPPEELVLKSNNEDYIELDLTKDYKAIEITEYYIKPIAIYELEDVSEDLTFLGDTLIGLHNGKEITVKENITEVLKLIESK